MMPAFSIRRIEPDEIAAVEAVTVAVYIGEGYTEPEHEPQLRGTAARAGATELLVAVDAETDQVFGSVSLMTESGSYSQIRRNTEAEFRLLAVDSVARGRGIGEALVQACMERARSCGCIRIVLSTQPRMAVARRLYERLGFRRAPDRDWATPSGSVRIVYAAGL